MLKRSWLLLLILGVTPALVGCDKTEVKAESSDDDDDDDDGKKKKKKGDDDDDDDDDDEGSAKKGDDDDDDDDGDSDSGDKVGGGLDADDNNEDVVKLAKKALKCEWVEGSGFKYDCEDLKSFKESDKIKEGRNDPTLVNFVGDKDEKVRFLGATALYSRGRDYRTDKELATMVVNALKKEKSQTVGQPLASAAGYINVERTGTKKALKKIAEKHDEPVIRRALIGPLQGHNKEEYYGFTKKLAKKDPDEKVRLAAVSSFWMGTPSGKEQDVCKLWANLMKDETESVAAKSAHYIGFNSNATCQPQWEALFKNIEARNKAGTIKDYNWVSALTWLHKQKKASKDEKERVEKIALAILDNDKNAGGPRASALDFLCKDGGKGKNFAKKYKNDKEFFVKSRAESILKK